MAGVARSFLDARLDVALVRSPLDDERLTVHPIATEERGLLVPEGHPAAGEADLSAVDFFDEPFVAMAPDEPSTTSFWLGDDLRGGLPARIGGSASTTQEALDAIAYRGLLTTGTPSAVRCFPLMPIAYVGTVDLSPDPLGVACRAGDDRPIVREFVDAVQVVASERADRLAGVRAHGTG